MMKTLYEAEETVQTIKEEINKILNLSQFIKKINLIIN